MIDKQKQLSNQSIVNTLSKWQRENPGKKISLEGEELKDHYNKIVFNNGSSISFNGGDGKVRGSENNYIWEGGC